MAEACSAGPAQVALSQMRTETRQAPEAVAAALQANGQALQALGQRWRARPPQALFTVARGSSDHAAQFLAWGVMARLGLPVASLPLSLVTLYGAPVGGPGTLAVALSQSGRSPDLVATLQQLRRAGSPTLALVNDTSAPLAQAADLVLPLQVGEERSVAATKSCLAQLALGAALVAHGQQNQAALAALQALPAALRVAVGLSESDEARWAAPLLQLLGQAQGLFVLGRGPGLAIACELALKLKESCGLQAEPFSGAEVQHGPMALVDPGFALLVLALRGPAQAGLLAVAQQLRERGARVLLAGPAHTPGVDLPLPLGATPELDGIVALARLYLAVERLARHRGLDPDRPPHLRKITLT